MTLGSSLLLLSFCIIVAMLVLHTPRSSFESWHQPHPTTTTNFLDLPAEVRIHIYELALANVVEQSLHVEHVGAKGWVLRHRGPKYTYLTPPATRLLEVNKQIHSEALGVLYKLCPNGPMLTIDHFYKAYSCRDARGWTEFSRISNYDMSPVREALRPVLRGARQRMLIEVMIPSSPQEEVMSIALLKWMRAVVNTSSYPGDEEDAPQLEELRVLFRLSERTTSPRPGMGIYDVFKGWRCGKVEAVVTRIGDGHNFEEGEPVSMPTPGIKDIADVVRDKDGRWRSVVIDENEAWRASEATWKRVEYCWAPAKSMKFMIMELPKPSQMLRWARGGR